MVQGGTARFEARPEHSEEAFAMAHLGGVVLPVARDAAEVLHHAERGLGSEEKALLASPGTAQHATALNSGLQPQHLP